MNSYSHAKIPNVVSPKIPGIATSWAWEQARLAARIIFTAVRYITSNKYRSLAHFYADTPRSFLTVGLSIDNMHPLFVNVALE